MTLKLTAIVIPSVSLSNQICLHPSDAMFLTLHGRTEQSNLHPLKTYCLVKNKFIYEVCWDTSIPMGHVGLSGLQRRLLSIALGDVIECRALHAESSIPRFKALLLEVNRLAKPRLGATDENVLLVSSTDLKQAVKNVCTHQVLMATQQFLVQANGVDLTMTVSKTQDQPCGVLWEGTDVILIPEEKAALKLVQ